MDKTETKRRISNAFVAMRDIGISEDKVKPALKNLLKLYDKNWELIEEENYRALADAIFEAEDLPNKIVHTEENEMDEEAHETEELERPLKRLRSKCQDDQTSSLQTGVTTPLVRANEKLVEEPQTHNLKLNGSQGVIDSPEPSAGNMKDDKNKGKQPFTPKFLTVNKRRKPCQPSSTNEQNTPLRIEDGLPSYSMRLRNKGKGFVSPQVPLNGRKSVPGSSSPAVSYKESGAVFPPKQKNIATPALMKPKDEPIMDDMPLVEAPIAVIHPYPSNGGVSSNQNGTKRGDYGHKPSILQRVETADVTASPNERRNNGKQATTWNECSSNLEIASSPFGEVKISLTCNLSLQRPNFKMPTLQAVLKSIEDKCLKSYKILDPSFSIMNLMKETCQSFLELGSESNINSRETTEMIPELTQTIGDTSASELAITTKVTPPAGKLKETMDVSRASEPTETMDVTPLACESTKTINMASSPIEPQNPPFSGIDGSSQSLPNEIGVGDERGTGSELLENCTKQKNDLSIMVVQQSQRTPEIIGSVHNFPDIAKGQENVEIMLVNEINGEGPPSFYYIPHNAVFQNANVNFSLARIGDSNCCSACYGDCLSLTSPCACASATGGDFSYTKDGLVKDELLEECIAMKREPKKHNQFFCEECPLERSKTADNVHSCKGHLLRKFIKECWLKCGCNNKCGNRVVQRGIRCDLQVFMTPDGKGWGLRTLVDLPKGAFVCEYVGEILTTKELFDRDLVSPQGQKNSCHVLLDAGWRVEGVLKDEDALGLDATLYGNVARFINHRCYDSSLVEIPVEVETPDRHYYHVALFTARNVKAMEELTWDYGIDFDDQEDHPIKAFRCLCGSMYCRNIKRFRSKADKNYDHICGSDDANGK